MYVEVWASGVWRSVWALALAGRRFCPPPAQMSYLASCLAALLSTTRHTILEGEEGPNFRSHANAVCFVPCLLYVSCSPPLSCEDEHVGVS